MTEDISCGVVGTVLGATGASLSVTELQAIVSIIVTILSFVIGVLVPVILKIIGKIREARKDGIITREEKEEIVSEINKGAEEIKNGTEELYNKIKNTKEK